MTKEKIGIILFIVVIIGMGKGIVQRRIIGFMVALFLSGCSPRGEVLPPATPPLSRSALGYGVVKVSYTRIFDEPRTDGVALGYVREKTILTVLERRLVKEGDEKRHWIFVEGDYQGWLPEASVTVYDNRDKARTAASTP